MGHTLFMPALELRANDQELHQLFVYTLFSIHDLRHLLGIM